MVAFDRLYLTTRAFSKIGEIQTLTLLTPTVSSLASSLLDTGSHTRRSGGMIESISTITYHIVCALASQTCTPRGLWKLAIFHGRYQKRIHKMFDRMLREHFQDRMEPNNALIWANPQTLPERSGSNQGTKHLEAKARQATKLKRKILSDYLIDNFKSSSHVRWCACKPCIGGRTSLDLIRLSEWRLCGLAGSPKRGALIPTESSLDGKPRLLRSALWLDESKAPARRSWCSWLLPALRALQPVSSEIMGRFFREC